MFRLGQLASIFGGRNLFIMQQSTRFASIISDGRGKCDESFDSNYKMCFGPSSESHLGIKDVTKENVWGYKFPQVCLKYGKEDSIQHALAGRSVCKYFLHTNCLPCFLQILCISSFINGIFI